MEEAARAGQEGLIEGIGRDAEVEADRIRAEARAAAAERLKAAQAQAETVLKEARDKAEGQSQALRRQTEAAVRMESKRVGLKIREEALRRVIQRARELLAARLEEPGYREILLGWVVEAAIGLHVPEAEVNASQRERPLLDEGLLRQAEEKVKELTGWKAALRASPEEPVVAQGVVLRSRDGRVEFNNQVSTRLLRYQMEIRKAVYEELFR